MFDISYQIKIEPPLSNIFNIGVEGLNRSAVCQLTSSFESPVKFTSNIINLFSQIVWIQNFTHGLPDPGTSRSPKRTVSICTSTINQTTLQIRAIYFFYLACSFSFCLVLCPILNQTIQWTGIGHLHFLPWTFSARVD